MRPLRSCASIISSDRMELGDPIVPIDLSPHLDPATTAVVALEVQENLMLPESAMIPGLAAHATAIGLIDRLASLFASARRVGVRVLYVIDQRRADGVGAADNLMVDR